MHKLILFFFATVAVPITSTGLCPTSFFYYPHGPLLSQQSANDSILTGPFWTILHQTYDLCCPLNTFAKKPIRPVRSPDQNDLADKILNSYTREIINSVAFASLNLYVTNTTGMFGIIGSATTDTTTNDHYFNKLDNFVNVISSDGFYLISKHEINGFPTTMPIVLELIVKAWPLLAVIFLINGYSSLIFWSVDKFLGLDLFPRSFLQGFGCALWWLACILFSPSSLAVRSSPTKAWAMRLLIVVWMGVCGLIAVICVGLLAAGLTVYALNGRSLSEKVVGVDRHSSDKVWLKTENANIQGEVRSTLAVLLLLNMLIDF